MKLRTVPIPPSLRANTMGLLPTLHVSYRVEFVGSVLSNTDAV